MDAQTEEEHTGKPEWPIEAIQTASLRKEVQSHVNTHEKEARGAQQE
jgi:hypothetical protein